MKDKQMGLNIRGLNSNSIIDKQALTRVTEQIFNPNKESNIDISKLDLSKFNRVSLGTDLYAQRTNTDMALKTSKAATDFDVNLSKAFSANVQYLNSVAAQSLFTSKENTGKIVANVENLPKVDTQELVQAASNVNETSSLNKDRRGSNPFSFYISTQKEEEDNSSECSETAIYNGLNLFA